MKLLKFNLIFMPYLGRERFPMPEERKRLRPLIHPPLPGSKPQAIWPTIANTAPSSISITSWNRIIGLSNAGSRRASISDRFGELGAPSPATRPCT